MILSIVISIVVNLFMVYLSVNYFRLWVDEFFKREKEIRDEFYEEIKDILCKKSDQKK